MSNRPTIAYQPALDGIRALAVVAVLLFHAEVPGFDGGYLGVSVFFTLSGFLITSLLVHEHTTSGHIDLGEFYARRIRRLLPASLVTIAAVVVLAALTDVFDGATGLRDHVLGSVLQIANWVFLAGDGSYQDLLARSSGAASPLEHFWSLAIEEQFYWVWPPVMLLILSRRQRRTERIVVLGAFAALASVAAPLIAWGWGADAAYWASPARFSEILIGALLAILVYGRSIAPGAASLAPIALVVLAAAVVTFPTSGGPAYSGALPLVGVVSAVLILGVQTDGVARNVLSAAPLVAIGKVSYGLYVFHWPIFVIVNEERFDWSAPVLLVVRLLITAAITIASYELIEQPIRTARSPRRTTFAGGLLATGAAAVLGVFALSSGFSEYWEPDAESVAAASIRVDDEPLQAVAPSPTSIGTGGAPPSTSAPPSSTPPPSTLVTQTTAPAPSSTAAPTTTQAEAAEAAVPEPLPELTRPVRVIVAGDSTAKAFGTGLVNWAAENPDLAQVEIISAPGCGFLRGGERRIGDSIGPDEGCVGWAEEFLYAGVERLQPDVVVAMVTSWDLIDRRWDTDELIGPLDPAYQARLAGDYQQLADDLAVRDTKLALVRHPTPDPFWLPRIDAQEDPQRHAVIYDVYADLASRSDAVAVVALDNWLRATGLDQSEEVRPDGIHITPEAATVVASDFLGEQVVRIALGLERL